MSFLYPEFFLLGIPISWFLWKQNHPKTIGFWLRGLLAATLLTALAGPYAQGETKGRDLVLLVDRSRSMPAETSTAVQEFLRLASGVMETGDRLSLLAFGANTALERSPRKGADFGGFQRNLDVDGTHLAEALEQALALIPENRQGSILLFSDGEFHGETPNAVARKAAQRQVRIDVRPLLREKDFDVAVESIELPHLVSPGEPFQFSAWVRSDQAVQADFSLYRGDTLLAEGQRNLHVGLNHFVFRDRGGQPGLAEYHLEMKAKGDTLFENNRGLGVLRVEGSRPVLLLNHAGKPGRLAAALSSAGIPVVVRAPQDLPEGPSYLEAFGSVILEDVDASSLGAHLPYFARQVQDLAGGFMMTGGKASFGVGGYYRSDLDPALPVTMEMRVEHRKQGIALAVVLDRSGSMAASAGTGNLTKMDLANAGTMEGLRLLGPLDQVSVIAVDSEPHIVIPLSEVTDPEEFTDRVSGIRSMGGGIYTYTGLRAAAEQLEGATRVNRHIILFADAQDAEEPGEYIALLEELAQKSTTVSVVALGQPTDIDADFLRDVAKRGGGEIYFTTAPSELPRIFAQDTLLAARAAFIEEKTASTTAPGLFAAAVLPPGDWSELSGYNLTYLRPQASAGVLTQDEYRAPVIATMQAGLGRTAAFLGQVDGPFGVPESQWPRVAETLVTLVRWTASQPTPHYLFTDVRREGREAVVTVDVDPELGKHPGAITLHAVSPTGESTKIPLSPTEEGRFEARVPLSMEGLYRFAASTEAGENFVLEPLAIPYSPEFEARPEGSSGRATLTSIARLSRGHFEPSVDVVLEGHRGGEATQPQTKWFLLAAIALLLSEISVRRLWAGFTLGTSDIQKKEVSAPKTFAKERKTENKSPVEKKENRKDAEGEGGLDALLRKAKAEAKKHDR